MNLNLNFSASWNCYRLCILYALDEKDAQIEHLKQRLNDKDAKIAELKESNALYARATEMVNVDELAKFQEMALREYLAALAAGN